MRDASGMFEYTAQLAGTVTVSLNTARNAGSSQQGNMRRASVAWNIVLSSCPSTPSGVLYCWA